jgi:hypothetical protein
MDLHGNRVLLCNSQSLSNLSNSKSDDWKPRSTKESTRVLKGTCRRDLAPLE